MPSPRSAPPTRSAAPSAGMNATSLRWRHCSTTSAASTFPPAPRLQGRLRRGSRPGAAPARPTRAARHRPHPRRRRTRPALEPAAADRGRDRAPPRRGRRGLGGDVVTATWSPTTSRANGLAEALRPGRACGLGAKARRAPLRRRCPGQESLHSEPCPLSPRELDACGTSPRAWSTSRSPARCSSRS